MSEALWCIINADGYKLQARHRMRRDRDAEGVETPKPPS